MGLPALFSLDGKVALVTGAGSGLGWQFSEMAAEQDVRGGESGDCPARHSRRPRLVP
jgi:hypothetical protein